MDAVKMICGKEFRRMQLIQTDMIVELDRVCRLHGIRYVLLGGSMLGAVRHHGYIPWDDDADIGMLREDYEQFKKCAHELDASVCFFQDHETDDLYRWGYGKLRRTGTTFVRQGQEHIKCKTGVFIDIFPFDDIPTLVPLQILQDFYCFCLRKILWSEVAKKSETGIRRLFFSAISKIPVKLVFKAIMPFVRKSRNTTKNRVRVLLFPSLGKLYLKNLHPLRERYGMCKDWFLQRCEYVFEGHKFYGSKDYHNVLSYEYGDYMKLPPENKREPHAPVSSYSFGNITPKG